MQTGLSRDRSVGLSEKQRTALISLLADEDPAVYRTIRTRLLSYGKEVGQWLRPHLLSADPVLRRISTQQVGTQPLADLFPIREQSGTNRAINGRIFVGKEADQSSSLLFREPYGPISGQTRLHVESD